MPASPPPKTSSPPSESSVDDRPTSIPEFDPDDFARDSELRQRASIDSGSEPTVEQARRLHQTGDDEQALFLLTRLLDQAPLHPVATALAATCREALEAECLSAVGSSSAILVPSVSDDELKTFALDNVSAFLMSRMDAATDVETLLDICGLPRLLGLRHLRNLFDRGLVAVASTQIRPSPKPAITKPDRATDSVEIEIGAPHPHAITLDSIAVLLVTREEIATVVTDPRSLQLLAFVNDRLTVEEILDTSHTDLVDGITLFERLAEHGVVAFV